MRVVIVGGAGFLGCAIARRFLDHGCAVQVLDTDARLQRSAAALAGAGIGAFDFARDAAPAAALAGADVLVHLGCTTNPARSMQDMAYDAESNIAPSVRLFAAAGAAGVRRVVFSSSGGTVYGAPRRLPVQEDDEARPLSAYGVSKLAIERYLALNDRVEGVSLRVSNPYGVGQLRGAAIGVIARYAASVARGEALEVWGDGSIIRDYLAVEDAAEAFLAAALAPSLAAGVYNVGSGEGVSIRQVIEAIFRASGREVPVAYLPGRAYDVPAIVLDSTRLRRETAWRPATSLDEGVAALWRAASAAVPGA